MVRVIPTDREAAMADSLGMRLPVNAVVMTNGLPDYRCLVSFAPVYPSTLVPVPSKCFRWLGLQDTLARGRGSFLDIFVLCQLANASLMSTQNCE